MANEKHIFIGIGGQGVKTVAQIKEKVYAKRFPTATESKSRLQAMNDSYRFLFLDTDQRDIDEANKRNRASFENGKVPFISPQTDLINLGRANPHAIYYEAKQDPNNLINKRILEACSPELASKIPDQPLSFGAGAFRIKSRIAFAHALADFQTKLQSAISSLNDVKTVGGGDCIIYYWLVSSSLGGTGSGIFNDVLYHINQLHHQVVGNGDPQLVYTMYMPKVFIDCNATEEKYSLNAFGVFSELEAFKVMSYEPNQNTVMHRLAFNNDYNLVDSNKRYCPFYYLIPIDIQTDKGTSLGSPHVMIRNTAEMLYHLHNGQAGATFRSDIDNYMNDIMERNHKNFLVPMGYVSLQKPNQFFNEYMRTRLRRDILRSWLLCAEGKESKVTENAIPGLVEALFDQLNEGHSDSIAQRLSKSPVIINIKQTLQSQDPASEELDDMLKWGAIESSISGIVRLFENEKKNAEQRDKYKKIIIDQIWSKAEEWIRTNGLTFAHEGVEQVRNQLIENLKKSEESVNSKRKQLAELLALLPEQSNDAEVRDLKEKITKTNKEDINKYLGNLQAYVNLLLEVELEEWKNDIRKDFCNDDKNDELAKLRKHIASLKDKVAEMNRDAVKEYKKLAVKMSEATLDVTTVYLPQLSTICDGNGWVIDNIFSKLYATFIKAQTDAEETPERADIVKFIQTEIYLAVNEETRGELAKGQYILQTKKEDPKTGKEKISDEVRFFCNPNIERSSEKIVDDFMTILQTVFEKKLRESKDIQEKWETKRVSAFFDDLTNDQKDIVRNSLNPSLFFSYNTSRIEVTKKEEHIVFVAGTEDLAVEMLGFQKGNPKHRYEKADSDDVALVLKSKYGLSLEDYRIYDSIKAVYDRATFREKYHFHHDFAQYLDKLTLNDLPEEVLPQHRTYAKILLLDSFKEEMKQFFYQDEFDTDLYTNSMLIEGDCTTEFRIAQPEAFYTDTQSAKLALKIEDNGRPLFITIEGDNFVQQFAKYCQLYYNYRIGETTEAILQELLRQKGEKETGERILKTKFPEKRQALLKILHDKKKNASLPAERRLYNVLFTIVREEFENVQKFIKK